MALRWQRAGLAPVLVLFSWSLSCLAQQTGRGDVDDALWERHAKPYLALDLWTDERAYDATEFLMVPLQAAFQFGPDAWRRDFGAQFLRFSRAGRDALPKNALVRLHYLYLASWYPVLSEQAAQAGGGRPAPPDGPDRSAFLDILYQEVYRAWAEEPAWQWGRGPFPGGIRERVAWKLSDPKVERSYYKAIVPDTLFLLATAANLRAYELLSGTTHRRSPAVAEMLDAAERVFRRHAVVQRDGGWVFQPGAWTDHPDDAYAGREQPGTDLTPAPQPGVAWDTSHGAAFPAWLTSLIQGSPPGSERRRYYEGLRDGLDRQFFGKVVVAPTKDFPAYRTTNYLDGRNGLYRWGYQTLGPGKGYGPYELSGTLLFGWWSFLGTEQVRTMYRTIAGEFPLPPPVVALYLGPAAASDRTALDGFRQLLCDLAARLRF